jgi:hypothetical protein
VHVVRRINMEKRITEDLVKERYSFGRVLGKGASATVYEATHLQTGTLVAIKVIRRDEDDGGLNDSQSMVTELEILRTVRHRHVLNCLELFESKNVIWVVMEAPPPRGSARRVHISSRNPPPHPPSTRSFRRSSRAASCWKVPRSESRARTLLLPRARPADQETC